MKIPTLVALLLLPVAAHAEATMGADGRITLGPLKRGTVIVEQYTSGTAKSITLYDDRADIPETIQQGNPNAACNGFATLTGVQQCVTIRER